MPVRLDQLWASGELPSWCRAVNAHVAEVAIGVAPTDSLHDGDGWVDVRRVSDPHGMMPEVVIELDDVVVSSRGSVWKDGTPVLGRAWGITIDRADDSDDRDHSSPPIALAGTHGSIVMHAPAFGHWLLQRLPRLHSLTAAVAPPRMLTVELPYDDQPFFDCFEIARGEVHRLPRGHSARAAVERLVLTTDLAPPADDRRVDARRLTALVDALEARWGSARAQSETAPDLYITRRDRHTERAGCTNRDELERYFAEQGYDIVHPPDLSIPEQFALFRSARSVVGELGSGMHWSLACTPGTSITYITPRSGTKRQALDPARKSWMRAIADARGLHFGQIVANPQTHKTRWSADLERVRTAWEQRPETIAPHSPR